MQIQRPVEGFPVVLVTLDKELHESLQGLSVELGYPVQEVAAGLLVVAFSTRQFFGSRGHSLDTTFKGFIVDAILELREKTHALRPD